MSPDSLPPVCKPGNPDVVVETGRSAARWLTQLSLTCRGFTCRRRRRDGNGVGRRGAPERKKRMDSLDSGQRFSPTQDAELDTIMQFLPASDSRKLEKKLWRSRKLWIGVGFIFLAVGVALLSGLLVWNFNLHNDVWIRKLYIGSLGISNQQFLAAHEDPNSPQFKSLTSQVMQQLKLIYSRNSVLSKYYTGFTVQAFSQGDGGSGVAYYQSEFDVPAPQQDALDDAIASLEPPAENQQGRQGRLLLRPTGSLDVHHIVSGALDPRMSRSTLFVKKSFSLHVHESGTVQSPGFPDAPYPPNVYLQWRLRADPGHRVRLNFHTLILEDDCERDFIGIYDSLAPIAHCVLKELCGFPHDSLSFLSSGNVMLITMVTSEDKNFPGFRASYSQIPLPAPNCGGNLSGLKGSFSSPFFPSNYPPQITCVWDIQVPEGNFVKVQFLKFFLSELGQKSKTCPKDYVDLRGQRLCGVKPGSSVLTSQSNKLTVTFRSDSYVDQGFIAEYKAFVPDNPCPGSFWCINDLCINQTLWCDGWNDCGDDNDEDNCVCEAFQIRCKNGQCKPEFWQCDGVDDCGDNTDEENCGD
ncbi:hypothetical protein LDENG_00186970 [Lucifuga dentata]|nr:hypothetical protein LDENG_00186970 [Lucifuga dentata]